MYANDSLYKNKYYILQWLWSGSFLASAAEPAANPLLPSVHLPPLCILPLIPPLHPLPLCHLHPHLHPLHHIYVIPVLLWRLAPPVPLPSAPPASALPASPPPSQAWPRQKAQVIIFIKHYYFHFK
jgi:hypothetical protein